jgi:hypothetical protein
MTATAYPLTTMRAVVLVESALLLTTMTTRMEHQPLVLPSSNPR